MSNPIETHSIDCVLYPHQTKHLGALLNIYIIDCFKNKLLAAKMGDSKWLAELDYEIMLTQQLLIELGLESDVLTHIHQKSQ